MSNANYSTESDFPGVSLLVTLVNYNDNEIENENPIVSPAAEDGNNYKPITNEENSGNK